MSKEMSWRRRIHHNRRSPCVQPTVRHMLIDHRFMSITMRGLALHPSRRAHERGYIVITKSRLVARRPLIKMTFQSPVRRGLFCALSYGKHCLCSVRAAPLAARRAAIEGACA